MVTTNKTYSCCKLQKWHWDQAIEKAKSMPVYRFSHRKEEANEVGALGEVVAESWFRHRKIKYKDETHLTTEHDYLISNKFTLDVKTKDRTVVPQITYDNSVPLYNHKHQRPDYYLFISLLRDRDIEKNNPNSITRFTDAFIVGGTDILTLDEQGVTWRKGETDPSNGTVFWTDCINIKMDQLTPLNELVQTWS